MILLKVKKAMSAILMLLSLFNQSNIHGQDYQLDSLYAGGTTTYNETMRMAIKYPRDQFGSDLFGFVIYEIAVDTTGKVTAKLMTLINEDFEKSIISAIQNSSGGWIAQREPYVVYQPVLFNRNQGEANLIQEFIPSYPSTFNYPLLSPIDIVFTSSSTRTRISSTRTTSTSMSGNSSSSNAASISQSPPISSLPKSLEEEIKNYKKLEKQLQKALEKGKERKAFKTLNEMILMNPFDKELIYQRLSVAMKLGDETYRAYDIPWLKALTKMEMNK